MNLPAPDLLRYPPTSGHTGNPTGFIANHPVKTRRGSPLVTMSFLCAVIDISNVVHQPANQIGVPFS